MTSSTLIAPSPDALFVAASLFRHSVLVVAAAGGVACHGAVGLVVVLVPGTALGRIAILVPDGSSS